MTIGYYELPTGRVTAIDADSPFPPLSNALMDPNGLIAIGGDLSVPRLLDAYSHGIFPWYSDNDPILWWSPNPRMVLFLDELKVSHSLAKTMRTNVFDVRFNTAFREVITACSNKTRPGQLGTWITDEIIEAYCAMFEAGYAVSAETWQNNQLVGGCYGVKIGKMFFGESMFHDVTDASKVAFVSLMQSLKAEGFKMIDCQMKTAHLASLGAREISREVFAKKLTALINS
ncbi:MAG TPA: leucyl/phenylalanyl-tRNA--protein transferase [Methylotenera sp.]|nr:leucyl/phenylalanyl-tRNA--protein transferase [Methylotenera sp.]